MIRVVLADDHALIRDGIKAIVASDNDIKITAEAGTLAELLPALERGKPDVLVLDLALDTEDPAFEAIALVKERRPGCRVLIVSMYAGVFCVRKAMKAGASGYLPKSEASDHILRAIHAVAEGECYLSPGIAARVIADEEPAALPDPARLLTNRELDVFHLIARGLTAKGIAAELGISHSTVGTHIENIKHKLNTAGTGELTRYAMAWELRGPR